jgi:hypothetical protein
VRLEQNKRLRFHLVCVKCLRLLGVTK